MSPPALQLKEIFAAALTIKDPAERAAYLAAACADAEVRVRIEGLLRASEDPVSFLDGGLELPRLDAEAPTRTFRTGSDRTDRPSGLPASEQAGAIVDGRYKLLERIGEGGMGTVWVAEQTHPIKRKVALKLIKAGMDSRSVLARFEAERQALALMDHPNIARVLDGGLTEGGRPYFAMEYVKGIPIAEYCDANRLSVPDRLQLFVEVCSAVQHAHQKGIIHRDLKPSNILVAPYDDRPVPKVIDFGLAKAMHQPLTEMTLHTAHETVLGTPLYMSPEQAQLNNLDVDTRSDIYSLGVLLYELLTGTTPLERKRFKEAAWDEIRRIIREEEPQRPSARLSSAATLPSLAASRRIEPIKLAKLLRGELDWIVMKALEKDRTRRYETANGLARDIQRYLSDEIVEARPPSSGYRIRKFVRRYKGRVLATSVLFLALLLGIAGTTFGLVRAEQQRRHAEEAASSETEARLIAQKAAELELLAKLDADEKRIEAEKQRARAVAGEQLASERYREVEAEKKKVEGEKKKADAERKRAEEEKLVALSVRDFLQNKLLGQADSRIQANSLLKIGKSPEEVKLNPTIRELLDRAAVELAPDRIEQNFANQPLLQAELLYTIGNTYRGVGEPNLSIAFLTRALELQQTHLGAEHLNAINTMGALATSYRAAGNTARSIELLEKVRDEKVKQLGAEHPSTLSTMNNLGMSYLANGKVALAIQHLEGIREADLKHWGPDHPIYINTLNNLGCAYAAGGNPAKAIEYFEIVYERRLPQYGLEHPYTLTTLHRLAGAYQATGKTDRAIEAFEKVRDVQVARLGPEHPNTLATYNNLALAYHFGGRLPEAIDVLERVREIAIRKWGEEHPSTLIATGNLAGAYQAVGKLPQAIEMFERVWRAQVAKRGINNPDTLTTRGNLASAYREAGDLDKALQHFEPVARGIEKLEFQHEYVSKLIPATIQAYEAAGEFEKAEAWRRKWLPIERQRDGANSAAHASELAAFALNLLHLQKYGEAEPLLRDCLRICEKLSGEKGVASWKVANVKSMLGEALLQQDKIVDAETFLHAGYEGLKRELRAIPDPLRSELMRDAIGRLAELASVEEKPAELEKWRAELAKYKPLAPMPRLVK